MRIRIAVPENHVDPSVIDAALEAVTRLDHSQIASGDVPLFNMQSPGVRWRPENMGDEHFDHAGTVIARGWGDCDDLAPWHAASLRATGEDPGATAIVVPSGPEMYHAIVRRSDGSNDDPSVAAGMRAKSVVGDGGTFLSVWAIDPHDGRLYQGQLAPTVAPLVPYAGPSFAVRALTPPGSVHGRMSVVGYQARVDVPVCGSRMVHVRSYYRHAGHRHGRGRHVSGMVPYALSCTAGDAGWSAGEALSVACAGALHAGRCAGTAGMTDAYKLFAMHRLLAGHHPSDVTIELAQMMARDSSTVHGYVVGDMGSMLQSALAVVQQVAPALASIPGVGPALSQVLPFVSALGSPVHSAASAPASGAPAPGLSPQPAALAAAQPAGGGTIPSQAYAPAPTMSAAQAAFYARHPMFQRPTIAPPPAPALGTYNQTPAPATAPAPAAAAAPPSGGGGFNWGTLAADAAAAAPLLAPLAATLLAGDADGPEVHPETGEVIHDVEQPEPDAGDVHPDTGEPIHDADAPVDVHPETGEPIYDVEPSMADEVVTFEDAQSAYEAAAQTYEQGETFEQHMADFDAASAAFDDVEDVPEHEAGDQIATYPPEATDFNALTLAHVADEHEQAAVSGRYVVQYN